MIIQILLSVFFLSVAFYAYTQKARSPFVSLLSSLMAVGGTYFVWLPDQTNDLAHWIGVGRGADLVFYMWIAISLLVFVNIHFKIRSHLELTTILARKIALLEAEIREYGKTGHDGE
jgi:hypothetical protein